MSNCGTDMGTWELFHSIKMYFLVTDRGHHQGTHMFDGS